MNQVEFARAIGVSQAAVSKYIRAGKLKKSVSEAGGRYVIDYKKAIKELGKNLDPAFRKKAEASTVVGGSAPDGRPDYTTQRTRTEKAKADLAELNVAKAVGEVVAKADVEHVVFKNVRVLRDAVFNIGPRLAPILAAETDEKKIVKMMHDEHSTVFDDLAKALRGKG